MKRFTLTRVAQLLGTLGLAFTAGHAHGAAFALQESSASGLGNAFAGGAAAAEDASTVWSNPAGMSRLASPQVAAAVHLVTPGIKFRDDGSVAATYQSLGHTGGDAGSLNVIPNLYLTAPIHQQVSAGLGINAPFGLVTDYGDGWLGRFQGMKSDLKTMNVNPSIAWRATKGLTIGVGVNYQQIDATLTNRVNYSAALAQAASVAVTQGQIPASVVPTFLTAVSGLEAGAKVEGSDSAWGWNVGILVDLDANSRIGAHYRSAIKYDIAGSARFDLPTLPALPAALAPVGAALSAAVNAALANGDVTAKIEMPAIANISYFRRLNDRWDVMADVQWTGWSTFEELRFVRTGGATLGFTPERFKDAWRYSIGANYRPTDQLTLRGGLARDETPVNDIDRTPRLPDESRVWFSLGAQYATSPKLKFDVGVTYIMNDKASINQNAGSTAANGLIKGSYDANVTIISGQVTYTF